MASDELNKINEGQPVKPDRRAFQEEKDYRYLGQKRRFGALNWCFIVFIWVCVISVGGIIVIKILHILLPSKYCWLAKELLANINDFFVDGSIGGLVVGFLKSNIIDN